MKSCLAELPSIVARICETGQGVDQVTALALAQLPEHDTMWLMAAADAVRQHFKGNRVRLCSIVNAKSGHCGEDCAFCAQSRDSTADIEGYALRDREWLVEQARAARSRGAGEFSVVTSGRRVSGQDLEILADVVGQVRSLGLEACASLGILEADELGRLRDRGLQVFHHNLETARSHYRNIVSTREYDDNLRAVQAAKAAGLQVCCGGIFGVGESAAQRVELLEELAALQVDRVPVNFLIPIEGTRLARQKLLQPMEALRIIALARLILPKAEINVAGGRERVLGQLQACVFHAGANAILVGNYLTTKGRAVEDDLELVRACGMESAGGLL